MASGDFKSIGSQSRTDLESLGKAIELKTQMASGRAEKEILEFFQLQFKDSIGASMVAMCGNKELYIKCKKGSFTIKRTTNFNEPPLIVKNTKKGSVTLAFDEVWNSNTTATEWVKKLISSL